MKITAIYDNLGRSADRYTVLTDQTDKHPSGDPMLDQFTYLGCGIAGEWHSQWGFLPRDVHAQLVKRKSSGYKVLTHLGRLTPFEQLDEATQRHIAKRVLMEGDEDV